MPKNKRYPKQRTRKGKVAKVKKMVDGSDYWTKGEKLVKYGASYGATIASLAKSVGAITRMINTENKYIDNFTNTGISSTGDFYRLTNIAQGTDDNNRVGNSIKPQNITIRANIGMHESAVAQTVRIIVFVDKENDGANPTLANLLEYTASATGQLVSPINKDFSKRFVIMKDKTFNLQSSGTKNVHFKFYSAIDFHTYYDGTSANIGDAKENQIYYVVMTDDGVSAPTFKSYARINFTDN